MAFCAYCGTEVQDARYLCLTCGNPVSGAPKAVPAPTSKAPIVIILLIVAIPVVIAFLGIIAAIAIPNGMTAIGRSKQKRALADIRALATATEAYATEHAGTYPRANDVSSLRPALEPTYIKTIPVVDGWGNPYHYQCWSKLGGEECDAYAFGSAAKDGSWEHEALRDYDGDHGTTNFDCDIVFMNGTFVEYPEGVLTH